MLVAVAAERDENGKPQKEKADNRKTTRLRAAMHEAGDSQSPP